MNYNDRTFIKTILCIFAFIYFGLVDAAKRGFKWLAELLFAVALLFSLPARADAPLIWGSSGPQLIQSGALTAKDGSVYPKYYEKNYLAAGASSVGAAASPVWNASGAGITCTTTVTNLPDASVGTALAVTGQSGAAGTEYCFYNFDIDQADGSKVLKLVEDQLPISGYVASDFRLDVYSCTVAWSGTPATTCSGTATRLALSTDNSSGVTALPALTGTLTPPPTYSTPAYASAPHLQARIGLNGASTHQMNFAQVLTGPGTVVQSAVVGPWQSYTPIVGGVTIGNGTITAYWRQVGDTVEVDDSVVKGSTTTTSSSDLAFSLPNSWTINSSAVSAATRGQAVSGVGHYRGASTSDFSAIAVYISSTGVGLAGPVATANAGSSIWSGNSPLTNTNDEIAIHFVVPVNELAGQGTVFLGQGTPAYYYCTGGTWGTTGSCTTQQGQGGVLGGTTTPSGTAFNFTFTPTSPIPTGMLPFLEISTDAIHWFPTAAPWANSGVIESLRNDGTNYIGAGVAQTNSGQLMVTFGKYAYGTSGAWNGTWYWRVFVGYPNQAQVFANVQPGVAAGLVPATGLPGRTDGVAAPSGTVGEVQTFTVGATTAGGSTSNTQVGTFTLPAGNWIVTGQGYLNTPASWSPSGTFALAFGNASGSVVAGTNLLGPGAQSYEPAIASGSFSSAFGPFSVSNNASTTYYVWAFAQYGTSAPTFTAKITALRTN